MKHISAVSQMTLCSLFAVLLCVLSPIAVFIGPVPVSLSLFAVLLSAAMLGPFRSLAAILAYLFMGALGLPVFGGGMGGFGVLLGPTGGFIWSYLLIAPICGALYRFAFVGGRGRWMRGMRIGFATGLLALAICYLFGTAQYTLVANASLATSALVCIVPFLLPDLAKVILVCVLAERLWSVDAIRRAMLRRPSKPRSDEQYENKL